MIDAKPESDESPVFNDAGVVDVWQSRSKRRKQQQRALKKASQSNPQAGGVPKAGKDRRWSPDRRWAGGR